MDPVRVQPTTKLSYTAIGDIPFGRITEPVAGGNYCAIFGGVVDIADGTVAWTPAASVTVALVAAFGGANANQLTVDAGHTTGLAASLNISSLDLTGQECINLLCKSTVTLAAGDYRIGVSETAAMGGSPVYADLPIMTAGVWYYFSLPLVVTGLNAVVSVGIDVVVDKGALVFTLQHVRAGSQFVDFLGLADIDVAKEDDTAELYDEVSILATGLMRGQLAAAITCASMQRLYPIPGTGKLTTTAISMDGRHIVAAYPQATAAGTVVVLIGT